MKESVIRKKAIEVLSKDGWICWWPPRVKFRKEGDVFGIADILAWRNRTLLFVQITTSPNIKAREKKIMLFLEGKTVKGRIEVWGYHKKHKKFLIKKINA